MVAKSTSETSGNFHQTTGLYNPQDSHKAQCNADSCQLKPLFHGYISDRYFKSSYIDFRSIDWRFCDLLDFSVNYGIVPKFPFWGGG
jgi:hypothetical protein